MSDAENVPQDPPFGARLLAALRREGLPVSSYSYAQIQKLKEADREGVIAIMRKRNFTMSHALIQRLRKEEPEDIARMMAYEARISQIFLLALFF